MLTKTEQKGLYSTMEKELSKIVSNPVLNGYLKMNNDFLNIMSLQVKGLKFLETTLKLENQYSQTLNSELIKINADVKENLTKVSDAHDVLDHFNYVYVFLKNIYGLTKEDVLNSNLKPSAPITPLYQPNTKRDMQMDNPNMQGTNAGMGPNLSHAQQQSANPFMGQGFNNGPMGMVYNPVVDPEFYPYDTKPKHVPSFKKALGIIAIVFMVLLLGSLIANFFQTKSLMLFGVFGLINLIIQFLVLGFVAKSFLIKKKFDRERYTLKDSMLFILLLVILGWFIINVFYQPFEDTSSTSKPSPTYISPLFYFLETKRWYSFSLDIATAVAAVLFLTMGIIGLIISPKLDKDKINDAFVNPQKYMNNTFEKNKEWGSVKSRSQQNNGSNPFNQPQDENKK